MTKVYNQLLPWINALYDKRANEISALVQRTMVTVYPTSLNALQNGSVAIEALTTKEKMNVLDKVDAICLEKLLLLEKGFASLVAHADFDLFDPTSLNEQR